MILIFAFVLSTVRDVLAITLPCCHHPPTMRCMIPWCPKFYTWQRNELILGCARPRFNHALLSEQALTFNVWCVFQHTHLGRNSSSIFTGRFSRGFHLSLVIVWQWFFRIPKILIDPFVQLNNGHSSFVSNPSFHQVKLVKFIISFSSQKNECVRRRSQRQVSANIGTDTIVTLLRCPLSMLLYPKGGFELPAPRDVYYQWT